MEYNKGLFAWIRKTSFTKFFVAWLIAVFAFSIIYWLASPLNSLILNNEPLMLSVTGLFRSMFASLLVGTIFGFGKYIGQKVSNVAKMDIRYLEWMYNEKKKSDKDEEDWLYTLEQYLKP